MESWIPLLLYYKTLAPGLHRCLPASSSSMSSNKTAEYLLYCEGGLPSLGSVPGSVLLLFWPFGICQALTGSLCLDARDKDVRAVVKFPATAQEFSGLGGGVSC